MNGDVFKPECNGIDGVIQSYLKSVNNTKLSGPTNFAEIIDKINDRVEISEVS